MNLKFLKKGDLILLVVLVVACIAVLIPKYLVKSDEPLTAVIIKDGVETERIDLSLVTESYEYDLQCDPEAKLTVENDCIYYSYAECHDKVCMNTGKLTKVGDTAACLPSRTIVVIEGTKDADAPDIITY